ncbi:MAG: zinc ABC transporter substrate-binding protein [Desulfobacteraceae bacterium]|nr:zinc ABC transporter substrate-binding protein [Desulfobacteraceae bacterium]
MLTRKQSFIATFLAVTVMLMTVCSSAGAAASGQAEKLKVITTLFPLYDWARIIGGDKAEVTLLLPPGVESHSFDPTPKDAVKINKADLFIYTGKYMEPWAENVIKGTTNKSLLVIDSSHGIELVGEHGHDAHAFEWAGVFDLAAGEYTYSLNHGPDPSMKVIILPTTTASAEGIEAVEERAEFLLQSDALTVTPSQKLQADEILYNLDLAEEKSSYTLSIKEAGAYVFFTEHLPEEFGTELKKGGGVVMPRATEVIEGHDHGEHHGTEGNHHHGEEAEAHHHHHGGKDPHIWLDFSLAAKMVDTIAGGFAGKDPANRELYINRARQYKEKLQEIDHLYQQALSHCKHQTIIYGGHFAFGYFADRFKLEHVSPYKGFAPNAEPTPKDIAELMKTIKAKDIKYIFYEEGIDPKTARVISKESNTEKLLLHGVHNVSKEELKAEATYLSLMQDNLERLTKGLECQ